jgi:hypothetical protein
MVPNKGLYLDTNPIDQPEGTWRDARNLLVSKKKGAMTSDAGTKLTGTGFPFATAKPIGTTVFPDGSYVVYSDGINGGLDRLGVVNNGVYSDLIVDNILGFSADFPILASEIDYNYLGQRIISWTDKNNPPRILNIDELPFALDGNLALVNSDNIIILNVFPTFQTPNLSLQVINTGGAVKAGAYSFCIAYTNSDGTRTYNTPPQGLRYIVEDTVNNSFEHDGSEPGQLTSKLIRITLTGVDTNYENLVLIGISTINGIKTAFEIKEVAITSDTMIVDYIGSEGVTELSLEEVLTPRPVYNKSGAMTQLHNILYHGNLETQEDIDFQSIANEVRIFYNSKLVDITDVLNVPQQPGFAHGEVYAFYITFVLKNGSFSRAFHIPGRLPYIGETPSPTAVSVNANTTTGLTGAKVYQLDDTTNKGGHTYFLGVGTYQVSNISSGTNMGYWENELEVYPSNFPNLAGQLVRHHVFPTFQKCRTTHYASEPNYLKSKLDILGIDVAGVNIPDNIKDKISGWYIGYARKGFTDSINYGQDLLTYAGREKSSVNNKRFDLANNWSQEWLPNVDRGINPIFDEIRSNNLDLLFYKPTLSTDKLYIQLEAKYRYFGTNTYSRNTDFFGLNLVNDNARGLGYLFDYINRPLNNTTNGVVVSFGSEINELRALTEIEYLPSGVISGDSYNTKSAESIKFKIHNIYFQPPNFLVKRTLATLFFGGAVTYSNDGSTSTPASIDSSFKEDTYLYSIRQVKSNVHSLFNQQEIILTDKLNSKNSTSIRLIVGGDRFFSPRTIMKLGTTSNRVTEPDDRNLIIKYHICESRLNFRYRYEVPSNRNTLYYPKTPATSFVLDTGNDRIQFDYGANTNDFSGYKTDYNEVNSYNQPIIYVPSLRTTNKFPYRVIRSGFSGTNPQGLNSWKTYLSNDIYERNRNRGEIINLASLDDVLLIHHKYGLFRTIGANRLNFDATEVYLGAGDIFQQEPKEPIPSKLGYLGTQNVFGCHQFKGGYAWWNQDMGRVFLLTGSGVIELSNLGMYNYFRDNSLIDSTLPDNPINGQGLMTVYDPVYNRLIFTKKANTNPYTISFDLNENYWVGWHDYTPDYFFATNNNFFAFKNNKIHEFNDVSHAKYFEAVPEPTYVSLVYNQIPQDNKVFFNTHWISEMYDSNDNFIKNKTLSSLKAVTNYQDTGEISLLPLENYGDNSNIRAERSTWHFNKLRDANADVFKKKPLVGNYAIITYKYDNAPNLDSSQNSLYLYDFNVKIRKSEL